MRFFRHHGLEAAPTMAFRPAPDMASYSLLNATALEISMSTEFEALEAEVLKLAPEERSHLFERLVASLDTDAEIEAAWEREADRREAELESGAVTAIPGDEVFARLRARLARCPAHFTLAPNWTSPRPWTSMPPRPGRSSRSDSLPRSSAS